MIHLGIDTSNYKTSLAAVDDNGSVIANISEYLDVPEGQRGLRQSDAFFKHSNRLPELLDELYKVIRPCDIASVGVSEKPRRVEGSYMPCFLAGINMGKTIAETLDVPMHLFSHQEGHAAAIIESEGPVIPDESDFILMHLSGGTSEFLKCRISDFGYEMNIVGGSLDISFGQLLDRFGVILGFPFPSGMYIDKFASEYDGSDMPEVMPGITILDGYFNLSGSEARLLNFAKDFLSGRDEASSFNYKDISPADLEMLRAVSYEAMDRISDILQKSAVSLCKEYETDLVYMAGGVASSETIRQFIKEKNIDSEINIVFGDRVLSGDNAVGTALLSKRLFNKR